HPPLLAHRGALLRLLVRNAVAPQGSQGRAPLVFVDGHSDAGFVSDFDALGPFHARLRELGGERAQGGRGNGVMNPGIVTRINAFFTACYKLLGFAVLGAILIALASYLGVHSFFYTSESWIAPIIISSSDEEVIRLYGHAAEQQMERDRALAHARELRIRLSALERTIQSERRFQERFLDAVESDRRMRAGELRSLREKLETCREVRYQFELSSKAYAGMARKRAKELRSARLVDREEYLTVEHQLAQMARTRLSLAEAEAGIAGRISEIQARARALDDFVKGAGRGKASVDVVLIEREYLE